jgi:DNA-binding PadR family transcriptional regulator
MKRFESPAPDEFLPLPTAAFHILVALGEGQRHGYSIMQDIAERTNNKIRMSPGTLYAAMKRMLEQGLIEEIRETNVLAGDERRRYYRITKLGRRVVSAEALRMSEMLHYAKANGFAVKPR